MSVYPGVDPSGASGRSRSITPRMGARAPVDPRDGPYRSHAPDPTEGRPDVVNADQPSRWKHDITAAVSLHDRWFVDAAHQAFREARHRSSADVDRVLRGTDDLRDISPRTLRDDPAAVWVLRMSAAPPLTRDRLASLAETSTPVISSLEKGGRPGRLAECDLDATLHRLSVVLDGMLDRELFRWLVDGSRPDPSDRGHAITFVADRTCHALAAHILQHAQQQRQRRTVEGWLESYGYRVREVATDLDPTNLAPGTYVSGARVVVGTRSPLEVPVDLMVQPHDKARHRPLFIQAGSFDSTKPTRNKEAQRARHLRDHFGGEIVSVLLLGGVLDQRYLGERAAEGIDWIWEHRVGDLIAMGL